MIGQMVGGGYMRNILTYPRGAATGFEAQGGKANTNCGMIPDAAAVALNVATPIPQQSGYLTVFSSQYRPLASNLDYSAGQLTNNEIVAKIGSGTWDLSIYAHGLTHVVADVIGYYAAPQATAVECMTKSFTTNIVVNGGSTILMNCPAGYTATGGVSYWSLNASLGVSTDLPNDVPSSGWQAYGHNKGTAT